MGESGRNCYMKLYKSFIEENFYILDKEIQQPVPFTFNKIQSKYYKILEEEYNNLQGVREIILKARQEGVSSFALGLFTVDFLLIPFSVSICISHRKDATELLFKKVKFYIESYCQNHKMESKTLLKTDNKNMIENLVNGALFYVLTAGTKVGGRGGSCSNILFSEAAYYPDTAKISASEIITATSQQVPMEKGMIFIESTGNTTDDYYNSEWERANRGESIYKHRFFGWQEFYDEEWVKEKKKEFPNELLAMREYPKDPSEAFLAAGSPYFDNLVLKEMLDTRLQSIQQGRFAPDGNWT